MKYILHFNFLNSYSAEKMPRPALRIARETRRGNASANSGAQSAGSTKNEIKSKQEKELAKTVTEKQKRKTKKIERSQMDSPAMSTRAKAAEGKRKADMDVDKPKCGKMVVDNLEGNVSLKKGPGGNEQQSISEALTDVPKMESSVNADSKHSPKPEPLTYKALLVCPSPLPAEIEGFPPLSKSLQASKQEVIDYQKRKLDPITTQKLDVFTLEKKVTGTNKEMDEFKYKLKCYKDSEDSKLNLDLKQEASSEGKKKVIERKFDVEELVPLFHCSQDIDERKLKLDLSYSKLKDEISSEIERKELQSITEGNESTPLLQSSKDIDERMQNLHLKTSSLQQEFSLEYTKKVTKQKLEVDEPTSLLRDSKGLDINERILNMDLNAPIAKQMISSENLIKFGEPEIKEHENIIHLRRDVNLRFEFDNYGNRKVLVDDTDRFTVDEKQKLTFNIGDGNVQLSFIENKVCIFTERGEIDCSIRNNQVIFSLQDSPTVSDSSPEGRSTRELSPSRNSGVAKGHGSKNITGKTNDRPFVLSEEMHHESGFGNVDMSTQHTNLSLIPRSVVQQRLKNITDSFLASVISSCDNYEIGFLDGLKKGKNESPKE